MLNLLDNIMNTLNTLSLIDTPDLKDELDFTKKEDLDKLDDAIDALKSNKWFMSLMDSSLLDEIKTQAHKIYNESQQKKETDVPETVKNTIINLATEYVNTKIVPEMDTTLNATTYKAIVDTFADFGTWIYKK